MLRRFALRRLKLPLGASTMPLVIPDASDWIRRGQWTAATLRGAEPPYWVQVWPASVAIARLLMRHPAVPVARVLDLGCGLGVPGVAAASRGAAVDFADCDADALGFARWNAARLGEPDRVRSQRLDWSREVVAGTFDVVVLADVTYRPVHHVSIRCQLRHCIDDEGVVVHADPHRPEATAFLSWMRSEFHCVEASRTTTFCERSDRVRLCVGSRNETVLTSWRSLLEAPAVAGPDDAVVR